MANLQVKDGAGATKYIKTDGSGTDLDPHVGHTVIDGSALPSGAATEASLTDATTYLLAIRNAVQLLDDIVAGAEAQVDIVSMPSVTVGSSALPTGAATEATLATHLSESDFDTKTGSLTEAAPASDTASSGLNGRLQRIAQRLTSLIALLPTALVGGRLDVNVGAINNVAPSMGNGVSGTGVQRVTIASDSTGTVAVTQATASSLNAQVVGELAHDAVDSGNPVKLGAKAIAHGTNPTAVAANDRTHLYANRAGVPFVIGGHPNPVTLEAAYTAAQTDTAIVTISSGLKIVVTRISVTVDKANTVDVGYRVGFGATNTPTTTGVVSSHPGLAAGSGVVEGNGGGMLGVGADGEDLRITSEVPTSGSVRVVVTYYTIES